jgi:glutamate-1-semialdehyde 2,1-aminomutase
MSKYKISHALLHRALNVIPLGTQTFSKSYQQFPQNNSPLFLSHGKGSKVWDVDGNEYIDLISGLLPVILGYQDPDVNTAIKDQIDKGISFSLAHESEVELAEELVDIIPCAEMVRFGKNGSDATSAAIRLARAYTKRDHVIVCGYHGWHDWYITSTVRSNGVPKVVNQLTHTFVYNDIESLHELYKKYPNQIAAVILEPINHCLPENNFLERVKETAHQYGSLLIFDEVITGFRYSLGGAQKYFNVTPDLACFGKAMGNGMPISALVGRGKIMKLLEDVFVSSTFGGETLSIAAAIAVIKKMKNQPVLATIWERGRLLSNKVSNLISEFDLDSVFTLSGQPPWMILNINKLPGVSKELIKTIFMKEMIQREVLIQGSHNISYAHTSNDIEIVVDSYKAVLQYIADLIHNKSIGSINVGPPLKPIFTVR